MHRMLHRAVARAAVVATWGSIASIGFLGFGAHAQGVPSCKAGIGCVRNSTGSNTDGGPVIQSITNAAGMCNPPPSKDQNSMAKVTGSSVAIGLDNDVLAALRFKPGQSALIAPDNVLRFIADKWPRGVSVCGGPQIRLIVLGDEDQKPEDIKRMGSQRATALVAALVQFGVNAGSITVTKPTAEQASIAGTKKSSK